MKPLRSTERKEKDYSTTHGCSTGVPEYNVWKTMRQRCQQPKAKDYKYYGGRGIKVCTRWDSFSAFLTDMGTRPSPEHTIDRDDSDGNYEPGNCRWATRLEQTRNRRVRTHCPEGHPYSEDNLYVGPDGHRKCRACSRLRDKRRRRRECP